MIVPGLREPFSVVGFSKVLQAIRALAGGGTNAAGQATLAQSATQTVVTDRNCLSTSLPVWSSTSATAAAAGIWLKSVDNGSFTLGHASAGAGATLRYELRQPG